MIYTQPLKTRWLIILISLVTAFYGCAAKGPATAVQQGTKVVLTNIEPRDVDGKTEITIEATGPILQYTSFQLTEPLRLVVDIADSDLGKFQDRISVNSGAVMDITPTQKESITRLEFGLSQTVETRVYQANGKLMVELSKPAEETKTAAENIAPAPQAEPAKPEVTPAPAPAATPEAAKTEAVPQEQAAATIISAVRATAGKDGIQVLITGDGAMKPNAFMVGSRKLVVDIPGVQSRVKPRVIPVRKGGLDKVRVGQHMAPDQKVRVVLDLTKTLTYTVTSVGNTIQVAMSEASGTPLAQAVEKQPQEQAAAQPEQAAAAGKEAPAQVPPAAEQTAPPAAAPPAPASKPERAEAPKQGLTAAETSIITGGNRFTGRKISLDLQDADIVNVMRLFAEVANLNIILSPDVKGKVTVRMVNVPWDEAMSIILKMNGLGYALEDHILRIGSVSALAKEDEEELKAKEAKKKAEDLVTRIVPINYTTASVIEGTVKKSLSPRGETVTDARTNTLIVKDIARNVDEIVSLIKLLDKPIPQIMIEARIVEASVNFSRQIGVQWGGNFMADAAHGNSTGLVFPNSIGVTGGSSMGTTQFGNGNYVVNMPAAAGATTGGGAIGFTFGSISKALNLDLVLSALVRGRFCELLAPKVKHDGSDLFLVGLLSLMDSILDIPMGVVLEGTPPDAKGRTQPSLVAEVVSRSSRTRDYQTKREEYLDFGILEYWIVDPQLHEVTVLVREGADWSEQIVSGEQTIPSAVLPGLTCHVAELWVGVSADESDA